MKSDSQLSIQDNKSKSARDDSPKNEVKHEQPLLGLENLKPDESETKKRGFTQKRKRSIFL